MKTTGANRIITCIWILIGLSALKSTYTLVNSALTYRLNPFIFWLSFLNLVSALILLNMSFYMRKMVRSYTVSNQWQEANYAKMKSVGYWAIILVLIQTFYRIGYDCVWVLVSKSPVKINMLYLFKRFCSIILTESPVLWVLALSIFLFAELLKMAHEVKAENEAFI
ncbi:hypothetical protein [Mucilaginibacter lacusdianchii]|uniref:hypothetical protein n=1 Tax=Mucilaginibacter lacusdianchii TaxID=2684211 RepID=UPI00131B5F3C|nr:hypothetical protein [Mucilaginibacter sp. JXJ CY 39]